MLSGISLGSYVRKSTEIVYIWTWDKNTPCCKYTKGEQIVEDSLSIRLETPFSQQCSTGLQALYFERVCQTLSPIGDNGPLRLTSNLILQLFPHFVFLLLS